MAVNEITSLLSMLRFSNTDPNDIIRQITKVKRLINQSDFKTIINGDKTIKIGGTDYSMVSKYNFWSLRSQIEYEIKIRENVGLSGLYQYVKSL